jgi:hypothetical protein
LFQKYRSVDILVPHVFDITSSFLNLTIQHSQ